MALAEKIHVIPTFAVEGCGGQRSSQQVTNLASCHAGVDLCDLVGIQDIALLDVDPVYTAAREQGRECGKHCGTPERSEDGWVLLSKLSAHNSQHHRRIRTAG